METVDSSIEIIGFEIFVERIIAITRPIAREIVIAYKTAWVKLLFISFTPV